MSSAGFAAGITVGLSFVVAFSITPFPYSGRNEYEDVTITLERTVCFGACPDYPVTIQADGKTKTVYRFEPHWLAELEDKIGEIAGTEKWVKG